MAESKTASQQTSGQSGQAVQQLGSERQRGRQSLQRREAYISPFRGGPFEIIRRMSDEMERMFDRTFDEFGFGHRSLVSRESVWAPRIEAFQKQDQFIVRAELPGLTKDDVQVELTEDAVSIRGQRRQEQEEEREGFYHSERVYGSFYRAIPLPEGIIAESAQASFRDGVLEITMQAPPAEVGRGRRLEIKEAGEGKANK